MVTRQQLENLATEISTPCVTISLNTHRTHPDNAQDKILLKNLLKEAEERVSNEFGEKPTASLRKKLAEIEIDPNYNLDSLLIYVSNDTKEIVKSVWPVKQNGVHIADTFSLHSLIQSYNRSEEYFILLLSKNGVNMYKAINDGAVHEVINEDFPFSEDKHHNTHLDNGSDSNHADDLVREFFNNVDKAVRKLYNKDKLNIVIICTDDNYGYLMQVADKPGIYAGHSSIDPHTITPHHLATQSWEIIKALQHRNRTQAIDEMREAVGQGNVLTDLQEIYQAALDGRGDLLIVHQDFAQPVHMTSDRTFALVTDTAQPGVIDDITSNIAWEVFAKNGRVFFTGQDEIKDLGEIVLKARY